jgi:hypothetical protein
VDYIFWFSISFLTLELIYRLKMGNMKDALKPDNFAFLLVTFLLSALAIDFVHEFGHALWGTVAGGELAYMQITYFVIYPRLELASIFRLGYVTVTGLSSSFGHGLFLLGGSLTTNIVAWLLAFVLWKKEFSNRIRSILKMLGVIALLDLPFYVFLPQIGLRHWIVLGGESPEPLVGAREMAIPDPIFYLAVLFVTFSLVLLYFEPFRKTLLDKLRIFTRKIKDNNETMVFYVTYGNFFLNSRYLSRIAKLISKNKVKTFSWLS